MNKDVALLTAGIVFLLVAVLHLSRLLFKFDIQLAGKMVPFWANGIGLVIAAALSVWMFMAATS